MNRLREMQIFIEVIKQGSFSAAADSLNFSKQYVSRSIAELEKRLGVRLIHRTTRKLNPTPLGLTYYRHTLQLMEKMYNLDEQISSYGEQLKGTLRISVPLSYGLSSLSNILCDFLKNAPLVQLDIDFNDNTVDLLQNNIDLAIRVGHLTDSAFIARKLTVIRTLTVASPAYLREQGTPEIPQQLKEHRCLYYRQQKIVPWHYRINEQETFSFTPLNANGANNGDLLCCAAIKGLGITQLPHFIVQPAIINNQLETILNAYEPNPMTIQAVYPQHRETSPLINEFIQFLKNKMTHHF